MPCGIFIPRHWRLPKVIWTLIIAEFPFTVANLALFGIASPNLYRTILWAEGGRRGFNSDPSTVLYAAANYRPVKTPVVWDGFMTQYNLVIGVLCMFFYLIKCTLFFMHIFYPIISVPLHIALTTLWAYSLYLQTAPDTIDPKHQNKGAPWYIKKNCNIVDDERVRGYCMQAKSAFAVSVMMLIIYAVFLILSVYSLVPTAAAKSTWKQRQSEKRAEKEKIAALTASPVDGQMSPEAQWQHMWELQQLPRTPGTVGGMKSPITPRTRAFRDLGGTGALHSPNPYAVQYGGGNAPLSPGFVPAQAAPMSQGQHAVFMGQAQPPQMPSSTYEYPVPGQPAGTQGRAESESDIESPYKSNAEYYAQQESEWSTKGKGMAY